LANHKRIVVSVQANVRIEREDGSNEAMSKNQYQKFQALSDNYTSVAHLK